MVHQRKLTWWWNDSICCYIYCLHVMIYWLFCLVAHQMWCLAFHLPLLVGDYIPEDDEHWKLLCTLLEITRIVFAPTISKNQVAYLQILIQTHHERFKELFPQCNIIPKMHYMVHMPRTILRWVLEIKIVCSVWHAVTTSCRIANY